jgi:hypothetical protein
LIEQLTRLRAIQLARLRSENATLRSVVGAFSNRSSWNSSHDRRSQADRAR